MQDPRAIIADEPVSSVDPARAEDLVRLLVRIAGEGTLVASLHTPQLALRYFQRIIALRDGALVFDRPAGAVRPEHLAALYALSTDGLPAPGVDEPAAARWLAR